MNILNIVNAVVKQYQVSRYDFCIDILTIKIKILKVKLESSPLLICLHVSNHSRTKFLRRNYVRLYISVDHQRTLVTIRNGTSDHDPNSLSTKHY